MLFKINKIVEIHKATSETRCRSRRSGTDTDRDIHWIEILFDVVMWIVITSVDQKKFYLPICRWQWVAFLMRKATKAFCSSRNVNIPNRLRVEARPQHWKRMNKTSFSRALVWNVTRFSGWRRMTFQTSLGVSPVFPYRWFSQWRHQIVKSK